MPAKDAGHAYNDLRTILRLRALVAGLDPSGPPAARLIYPSSTRPPERAGVLAGSFNPLTLAHAALAAAAGRAAQLPVVYLLLSKVTVDKERVTGALLEDRLQVLRRYAARGRGMGVLLVNRGLYVEQAETVRRAFPALRDLYFIVGLDKILQIFDPRYYVDRDAALRALFAQAAFLVAPRGGYGPPAEQQARLTRLLAEPGNEPYQDKVAMLPLPARLAGLSSTLVRVQATAGSLSGRAVPREVAAFIEATGAYLPPTSLADGTRLERYLLRARLIDALAQAEPHLRRGDELAVLLALARTDSPFGHRLRTLLDQEPATALEEFRRLRSLP